MVVHLPVKEPVIGSSPICPAIFNKGKHMKLAEVFLKGIETITLAQLMAERKNLYEVAEFTSDDNEIFEYIDAIEKTIEYFCTDEQFQKLMQT
jgi:hypothetical protein